MDIVAAELAAEVADESGLDWHARRTKSWWEFLGERLVAVLAETASISCRVAQQRAGSALSWWRGATELCARRCSPRLRVVTTADCLRLPPGWHDGSIDLFPR